MTGRTIPVLLLADLEQDARTLCHLLRIERTDGVVLALTDLNKAVTYDDGDGVQTYLPEPGYDPTALESAADLSVDGGDFLALLPLAGLPISEADIERGLWDDAAFKLYRVNYTDLSHGHVLLKFGTLGEIVIRDGLAFVPELRGPQQPLRQNITWRDSIRCRAYFGSQEADEIEYCGFDVATVTDTGEVTSVGLENTRTFTASATSSSSDGFLPGVVVWTTGNNAGPRKWSIESFDAGEISLRFPLPYPIEVGDTFTIRPDCTKEVEGVFGCRYHFGNDWVNHFRGEPDIPQGEPVQVPGAEVGPGSGGSNTSVPYPEEA